MKMSNSFSLLASRDDAGNTDQIPVMWQ